MDSWDDDRLFVLDVMEKWSPGGEQPEERDLIRILQHYYIAVRLPQSEEGLQGWYEKAESFANTQAFRFMGEATRSSLQGLHGDDVQTHDGITFLMHRVRDSLAWKDLSDHFVLASGQEPENMFFWELLAYKACCLRDHIAFMNEEESDDDSASELHGGEEGQARSEGGL